jgi:hypothetical protein
MQLGVGKLGDGFCPIGFRAVNADDASGFARDFALRLVPALLVVHRHIGFA